MAVRLLWIFLGLALLFLISFLAWGGRFEDALGGSGARELLENTGHWAWAMGIALLMSDLLLPIPGTAIITALGFIYGPVTGGVIGACGSFLGGMTGYLLCRALGRGTAVWMVGEKDLSQGERLFKRFGGWMVVLSRWLPLFPEVIACMAGLTRMPFRTFVTALACGVIPYGLAYGSIALAKDTMTAFTLSVTIPPVLWLAIQLFLNKSVRKDDSPGPL